MNTIRQSLLHWCRRHHVERFRGGYRLEQYLRKSLPVLIKDYTPVYVDMARPNWQAKELFSRDENAAWDYEPHVSATLQMLVRPGDIVYDIGANIGLHTIYLHRLGAKVFAFEPNPKLIPNLRRTIKPLHSAQLFNMALSDRRGTATLFVPRDHDMASLGNWREDSEQCQCPMTTLDSLQLPPPDLIKCDVEGAELRVFRGGQAMLSNPDTAPIVLFEEHAVAAGTQGFEQDAAQKYLAALPSRYQFFLMNRETCGLDPVGERASDWCDLLAVPECRMDRMTGLSRKAGAGA